MEVVFSLTKSQVNFAMDREVGHQNEVARVAEAMASGSGNVAELLVFSEESWLGLKKRIEELKSERTVHKQKFK